MILVKMKLLILTWCVYHFYIYGRSVTTISKNTRTYDASNDQETIVNPIFEDDEAP